MLNNDYKEMSEHIASAKPTNWIALMLRVGKYFDDIEPYFFVNGKFTIPNRWMVWKWWGLIPITFVFINDMYRIFKGN